MTHFSPKCKFFRQFTYEKGQKVWFWTKNRKKWGVIMNGIWCKNQFFVKYRPIQLVTGVYLGPLDITLEKSFQYIRELAIAKFSDWCWVKAKLIWGKHIKNSQQVQIGIVGIELAYLSLSFKESLSIMHLKQKIYKRKT